MNYDYNPFDGANDFDYYGQMSVRDAKKAVSRTTLGIFLFLIVSSAVIVISLTVLAVALGKEKYLALANNPYFYIPMGTLAMHAIGFPFLWLCIRSLPTRRQSSKRSESSSKVSANLTILCAYNGKETIKSNRRYGFFHISYAPNNYLWDNIPIRSRPKAALLFVLRAIETESLTHKGADKRVCHRLMKGILLIGGKSFHIGQLAVKHQIRI